MPMRKMIKIIHEGSSHTPMRKMIKIIQCHNEMCTTILLFLSLCILQIECNIIYNYGKQFNYYECTKGKNYTIGNDFQAALGDLIDVGDEGGHKSVQMGESPNKVYAMAPTLSSILVIFPLITLFAYSCIIKHEKS